MTIRRASTDDANAAETSPLEERHVTAAGATFARVCAWCTGPIPAHARRDAETCSKRCRQARHRFVRAVGSGSATPLLSHGQPRRLAYADPPYPGKAWIYAEHPDFAGEVDHRALIEWLAADHDAWALSTSAEALPMVLALCPPGVRVAAWHRGFRPNVQAAGPLNAWEPVIYAGQILTRRADLGDASRPARATARKASRPPAAATPDLTWFDLAAPFLDLGAQYAAAVGEQVLDVVRDVADASRPPGERVAQDLSDGSVESHHGDPSEISTRRVDSLVHRAAPRTTDPNRVIGAKPAEFCRWVFDLLAATPADTFVDVFPGSGGVARAWEVYAGSPAVLGDRSW